MVIIQKKTGQLANRLFLFSKFIANALEYEYELINPCFDEYRKYFASTRDNNFFDLPISVELNPPVSYTSFFLKTNFLKMVRPVTETYEFVTPANEKPINLNEPEYVEKARNKTVYASGWHFNEGKNLVKHADIIRKIFRPNDDILDLIRKKILEIRSRHDVIVGVHMKRGDYRRWQGGLYFFEDETYYANIRKLEAQLKREGKSPAFIICSNEKVSDHFFNDFPAYKTGNGLIEDLYTLAQCDLLIGPPSTFTMWASFYGENKLQFIRKRDEIVSDEALNLLMP